MKKLVHYVSSSPYSFASGYTLEDEMCDTKTLKDLTMLQAPLGLLDDWRHIELVMSNPNRWMRSIVEENSCFTPFEKALALFYPGCDKEKWFAARRTWLTDKVWEETDGYSRPKIIPKKASEADGMVINNMFSPELLISIAYRCEDDESWDSVRQFISEPDWWLKSVKESMIAALLTNPYTPKDLVDVSMDVLKGLNKSAAVELFFKHMEAYAGEDLALLNPQAKSWMCENVTLEMWDEDIAISNIVFSGRPVAFFKEIWETLSYFDEHGYNYEKDQARDYVNTINYTIVNREDFVPIMPFGLVCKWASTHNRVGLKFTSYLLQEFGNNTSCWLAYNNLDINNVKNMLLEDVVGSIKTACIN